MTTTDLAHPEENHLMTTVHADNLVGTLEIAALADVKPRTVTTWRYRRVLPDPIAIVSNTPLWDRRAIEAWLADTGRAAS